MLFLRRHRERGRESKLERNFLVFWVVMKSLFHSGVCIDPSRERICFGVEIGQHGQNPGGNRLGSVRSYLYL